MQGMVFGLAVLALAGPAGAMQQQSAVSAPPAYTGPVVSVPMSVPVSGTQGAAPLPRGPLPVAPDWERWAGPAELAALYPDTAKQQRLTGRSMMECRFRPNGALTDCVILTETPPGFGFGRASLMAARYFKGRPTMPDGRPVEGYRIKIPLDWTPPSGP